MLVYEPSHFKVMTIAVCDMKSKMAIHKKIDVVKPSSCLGEAQCNKCEVQRIYGG